MKYSIITFLILFFGMGHQPLAQTLNWNNLEKSDQHILNPHTGWDYGMTFGIGYANKSNAEFPLLLGGEISFPAGKKLLEDFKVKIGAQARLVQLNHFHLSASVQGIYRRYENELVRLQNFGSEAGLAFGYYRSRWFVAAEGGFDKAIVTHFKHFDLYTDNIFPAPDGWFEPPSGGNIFYGLRTGLTLNRNDIYLRIGLVATEDFSNSPLVPYYAKLGYSFKLAGFKQ